MEPTQAAENVSERVPEIDVALAVAVLVPVKEHVLDPYAVKAPAGTVTVNVNCVPESVPKIVP
jgi:hypothetical protein